MEFNSASFLKARTGKFYFGGLNGVISFEPAKLNRTNEAEVSLQLISFSKYTAARNRVETIIGKQVQSPIVFSSGDRLLPSALWRRTTGIPNRTVSGISWKAG